MVSVGVIFGLPKFLSWALNTDFPMAAITSGSMWPSLKEGDLVFIQGLEDGEKDSWRMEFNGIQIPAMVFSIKDEKRNLEETLVSENLELRDSSLIPSFAISLKKEAKSYKNINTGDIVVYRNRSNNTFTIHRVIKLNEDSFVTKGDANFQEDAPARYEDLIGRALTLFSKPVHIPYLGSITVFANNLKEK
jgi:signal peptidase I